MNLKESIKRILREETDIPIKIRRRLLPKLIENAFQTALDGNTMLKTKPGSMLHKASFITFANFVIDDMVEYMEDQINMDGNSYYYGNDDDYIEEIRNPLLKHYGDRIKKRYDDIVGGDVFESVLEEETNIPLQVKRRINGDSLAELIHDIKSLIDSGYDESDAIYDTVRQFIASKQFKLNNDSEQSYWDSYIEVEEPLVDYVKSKLNIRESVLREETEEYKVKLVTNIIYTLYDNISFIKQSTFNGKPLLIIYFDSDDTAANIESWFDEKISRDIEEWTSGNIVVCPDWIFDWDERKKNADLFINTELIKYDNLGNVVNESVLREESNAKKKISALIDEYGLYDAAKILGLSFTQIVKISDTPINSEIANEILIENMRKGNLTENYKEFIIHSSYDGIFYWETNTRTGHFSNDEVEQITVAATPFWDGLDYTPVEIDWFTLYDKDMVNPIYSMGGEGNYFKKFTHQTNFETVEELNVWYNEVYLPGVYDIIMNSLLPKVYRLVDFTLNPR